MNKVMFILSLWVLKLVSFLIRFLHLGQGANLAGKIARKICPSFLSYINLENTKIVFITGTNGKSTTAGLVASMLKTAGKTVAHNRSGANLLSGVANTLGFYSDLFGKIKYEYLILEVDEATLPHVTKTITPHVIAITNLFRDQLDRFGELDTTAKLIESGVKYSKDSILILNADDPRVAYLEGENRRVYYGLKRTEPFDKYLYPSKTNGTINWYTADPEEATNCPSCTTPLNYKQKFLAHLGDYKCENCKTHRPDIDFLGTNFKTDNLCSYFDVQADCFKVKNQNFFLPLIGTYNLYNALCAISIIKTVSDVKPLQMQKAFQAFSTIFGRAEKVSINGKNAWIYLIKNPTGTTEVLKTISSIDNARFLVALNDNLADGRDVSWIWDARFDYLENHEKKVYVSGKRAYDMALRLKYANVEDLEVSEDISKSVNELTKKMSDSETLYILPTYTVLLEMQRKKLCKSQVISK